MTERIKYRTYFDIDEQYFPVVDDKVMAKEPNLWKKFFPHPTFVNLLKQTIDVLNRKQIGSIWVEGAYGTGKSHAVLTLKKLLDASEQETGEYFDDNELDRDLKNRFLNVKRSGKILTVHKYGSSNIRDDNDLVFAIQESISRAMLNSGVVNKGSGALRESIVKWLSNKNNKQFFDGLLAEEYRSRFGGANVEQLIDKLQSYAGQDLDKLMENIFIVGKEHGIAVFTLTPEALCKWIEEIIKVNELHAIVLIWDEFTEYFKNNLHHLTGFQLIAELSATVPFYFVIVSHGSIGLFDNNEKERSKIVDRFVKPICQIELPENTAFDLMGKAMRRKKDMAEEYEEIIDDLYMRTHNSREAVKQSAKIEDKQLNSILPIHPYAALLLKHIAVAFNSNQRSMFDFIKNDRGDELKGFQWFMYNYGPYDDEPFLTVEMLWDFFYESDKNHLDKSIRSILDMYGKTAIGHLEANERRVLRVILLLQAISLRVADSVERFIPNDKNLTLAFEGTEIDQSVTSIAKRLVDAKIIFKKNLGAGQFQYSILMAELDSNKVEEFKTGIRSKGTGVLLSEGEILNILTLPPSLKLRYDINVAGINDFDVRVRQKINAQQSGKICLIVACAKDNLESSALARKIEMTISDKGKGMVFVNALTGFSSSDYEEYIDNKANAQYQNGKDNEQSRTYEKYANETLNKWFQSIIIGDFEIFYDNVKMMVHVTGLDSLYAELKNIALKQYPNSLETYNVNDTMWAANSLKSGAECGFKEEVSGPFRSANANTKLEKALEGAWQVDHYWEKLPNLPISVIKTALEGIMQDRFRQEGRISLREIYELLKAAPYGFMPCNLTAFIMGFLLKEYVKNDYTWSDGLISDAMSPIHMKESIDEIIKLQMVPNVRYKDKYIVTMSKETKKFIENTALVFGIDKNVCGTMEQAREKIREKLKRYSFPIWVLKNILTDFKLRTNKSVVEKAIDAYCGIANSVNFDEKKSDNDIANEIGKMYIENSYLADDLRLLLNKDNCTKGMQSYLATTDLPTIAAAIDDNGQYINILRNKFDADAAKWVWNVETAMQKIQEVILEYKIVEVSNTIIAKNNNYRDTINEWQNKCKGLRLSLEAVRKYVQDDKEFDDLLGLLRGIVNYGNLADNKKQQFLDLLNKCGYKFKDFYANQFRYFKQIVSFVATNVDDEELANVFRVMPTDMFLRDGSEYFRIAEEKVQDYMSNQNVAKLKKLWRDKTGTESPYDWSKKYNMPALAMVPEIEYEKALRVFATINALRPDQKSTEDAFNYISQAKYLADFNSKESRDKAFTKSILRNYAGILISVDAVKEDLVKTVAEHPYHWLGTPAVASRIEKFAEHEYNNGGVDKAMSKIDGMDECEAKRYLKELIRNNVKVGIEILKECR